MQRAIGVAIGLVLAQVLQALARWHGLPMPAVVSDGLALLTDVLAAACLFRAAEDSAHLSKHIARGWMILALGMFFYAIGDGVWLVLRIISAETRYVSIADLFYLVTLILFTTGVYLLCVEKNLSNTLTHFILDYGVLLITAALAFWIFIFQPAIEANRDSDPLSLVLMLLYPSIELVLLIAVLRLFNSRVNQMLPLSLILLAAGGVTQIVTGIDYSIQSLESTYVSGRLEETGFILASCFFGLAGIAQSILARSQPTLSQVDSAALPDSNYWGQILNNIGVVIAYSILALHETLNVPIAFQALAMALGVIILLMLIRQTTTVVENHRLYAAGQQEIKERKHVEQSLRILEKALETMNLGVTITNKEGNVIFTNPADARMHGFQIQELIGKPAKILGFGGLANKLTESKPEVWTPSWRRERQNVRKDGTTFPVELISDTVWDEAGVSAGTVTTCQDITERRQAEQALRESEERLRRITDNMLDVILEVDVEGNIRYASPSYQRVLGQEVNAVLGQSITQRIHSEDVPSTSKVLSQAFDTFPVTSSVTFRYQHALGNYVWLECNANFIREPDGRIVSIVLSGRDITDRKELHDALVKSERSLRKLTDHLEIRVAQRTMELEQANTELVQTQARLKHLLSASPTVIYSCRASGDFSATFISDNVQRVMGFSPQDFIDHPGLWLNNIHPDDKWRVLTALTEKPSDETIAEYRFRHKNNSYRWVRDSGRIMRDANHVPTEIVGSWTDITEQKQTSERQRILYNVLRSVSGHLDMNTILRSAVETIADITGYPHVCAAMLDPDNLHWVVRGAAGRLAAELGATYEIHQGVIGRAFRTEQMQWVTDITDDPDYVRDVHAKDVPALQSEVVVLMRRGEHLFGALNVESDQVDAFNSDDVALIQSLSDVIVLALENARLYAQAQREIAERKKAEEALRASQQLLAKTFASLREAVFVIDVDTATITDCNPAASEIFGYARQEMLSRPMGFLHVDEAALQHFREQVLDSLAQKGYLLLPDFKMKCKDGRIISTENHVMSIEAEGGKRTAWVSVVRDITARKSVEDALRHLSTHDSLTGLYNRAFFQDEFERLRHSRQLPTSLIVVDIDGMKHANDKLGHSAGDELLIRTAEVLRVAFRTEDVVARIGGDEFAVLLPLTDQAAVDEALARCRAKLAQHNADHLISLSLSLGAATAATSDDFMHAFKTADEKMYQDKASHKGSQNTR